MALALPAVNAQSATADANVFLMIIGRNTNRYACKAAPRYRIQSIQFLLCDYKFYLY